MSADLNGTAIRKIMVSKLVLDPRVNRTPSARYVRKITEDFDARAVSVIQALFDRGLGGEFVQCRVHKHLSIADEAELSRKLNNTRRFARIEDFLKGIQAGDADVIAMNSALEEAGLHVSAQFTEHGSVQCVDKIMWIYYGGKDPSKRDIHLEALTATLSVITAAWGTIPEATTGHVVQGLGSLFLRHGEEIVKPDLVKKLAKFPGGPGALVGQARGLRSIRGGTLSRSLAASVTDVYNRGRRSRRLQETA